MEVIHHQEFSSLIALELVIYPLQNDRKYKTFKKGKAKTLRGFQSKLAWLDLLIPSSAQSTAPYPPLELATSTLCTCTTELYIELCETQNT